MSALVYTCRKSSILVPVLLLLLETSTKICRSKSTENTQQQYQFDVDFCNTKETVARDVLRGRISYTTVADQSSLVCQCQVCDTGRNSERRFSFLAESLLFTDDRQHLIYAYIHGGKVVNSSWLNDSQEAIVRPSLFSGCFNLTLILEKRPADVVVVIDGQTSRSEMEVTCSADGSSAVSDARTPGSQSNESNDDDEDSTSSSNGYTRIILGIAVPVLLIIIIAGGLCIYCRIRSKGLANMNKSNSATLETDLNGSSCHNYPDLHRHLDLTGAVNPTFDSTDSGTHDDNFAGINMTARSPQHSVLSYDNAAFQLSESSQSGEGVYHVLENCRSSVPVDNEYEDVEEIPVPDGDDHVYDVPNNEVVVLDADGECEAIRPLGVSESKLHNSIDAVAKEYSDAKPAAAAVTSEL